MARKKIFEYKAKQLLYKKLNHPYSAIHIDSQNFRQNLQGLDVGKKYAIKVDQGIKGRMKKGLVELNVEKKDAEHVIEKLIEKGYMYFIIEEMVEIDESEEMYLSIERVRKGKKILFAKSGGINVEENKNVIETVIENAGDAKTKEIDIPDDILTSILKAFDEFYFSFLEINPLVIKDNKARLIDTAVEVDGAGEFFVNGAWTEDDFAQYNFQDLTPEEKNIDTLSRKSQASFNLTLLNKNGSIFLLLSGGGASIVVADEAAALGYGKDIANYGEYSGNPNEEETYIYTKNVITSLLKSKSKKKVLIVAGGVANFTDVRITFRGIIRALDEKKSELSEEGVKVFVRRGGPNQNEGLLQMKKYLEDNNLYGDVDGPEMVLTDIVAKAVKHIN